MHINGPIENAGNHSKQKIQIRIDSAAGKQPAAKDTAAASAGNDTSAHYVSSPKVADLRQQLAKLPEVRREVVQNVANRVAAGEFSGSDVALRTAAAILNG